MYICICIYTYIYIYVYPTALRASPATVPGLNPETPKPLSVLVGDGLWGGHYRQFFNLLFHLHEELGDVLDMAFSWFGVSFGGPNYDKSSQNHDKVSPGSILAPKGAPGTESMQTGHSSTPPPGPIWSPKFVLFRSFGCLFPTYFWTGVWEGSRVDFSWLLDDFFMVLRIVFSHVLVLHRPVGNVVWIHYQ